MESEHDKAISCTSPNPLWATYLIRKNYFLEPTPYFEVARLEFA